jgi:hypothetical protein
VARRLTARALAAAALLASGEASAQMHISPVPILGKEAPPGDGWSAVVARLESTGAAPVRGVLEVSCDGAKPEMASRASFSLAPGNTSTLRVPVRSSTGYRIVLTARDERGAVLATEELRTLGRLEPLLVDVHSPPRLVSALRGAKVPVRYDGEVPRSGAPLALTVGSTWFDPATSDPVLPERTAEWGAATAVLISSDTLSRLTGPELEALSGYVIAGGSLAVVIRRPEDLRSATLSAMLGGEAREAGAAKHLYGVRSARVVRDAELGASGSSGGSEDGPDGGAGAAGEPGATGAGGDPSGAIGGAAGGSAGAAGRRGTKRLAVGPQQASPAMRETFVAYEGGNLVKSDFGATAAYGLGEVHLLAFDPTRAPGVDDPWAQSRMVELVRHAWDRRSTIAFPNGGPTSGDRTSTNEVRRQLDPNESVRWGIVIAAILLLSYSVVAGPLNFSMASRSGHPLRALRNLPILSAAVFLAIVLIAVASKGVRGEARRLSLVEASGGMTRATIRRYRSFFTPRSTTMTIHASDPTAVIDMTGDAPRPPGLVAERGGVRLDQLTTLPWQTVVAREDGLVSLGGGVALTRAPGGDVLISNRSARDLRALVVSVPSKGFYFLPQLKDGASALAASGKLLSPSPPAGAVAAGGMVFARPLGLNVFAADLNVASRGLSDAWEALAQVSRSRPIDWWPEEIPTLVAQVDGGEGVTSDEGLRLERDRMLLRVVGYGGTP